MAETAHETPANEVTPWSAIAAATTVAHQVLKRGLEDCATSQGRQLAGILTGNAASGFGRRHAFESLRDPDRYRAKVPLCSYDDLAPYLQNGSAGELLSDPVVVFEETGGSTGGAKLIPYSERSLAGFRRAVHPWLHDLFHRFPQLGRGYFAISPAACPRRFSSTGTAIGSVSDALYFGAELAEALTAISVVPDQIARVTDITQWQRHTLLRLLAADDLTFLSVWSPTFLTVLLAELPHHAEALLRDIHDGLEAGLEGGPRLLPDPARAAVLSRAILDGSLDTRRLWPRLRLVSAWTHAGAARFVPELRRLFPHATIQPKGLLCTEGVVSLPLSGFDYPVLAVHSGFFEFLDDTGASHLAHETQLGKDYDLVMTVPGLYRYRNGDRVRVQGWAGSAPQLEFIGRAGLVSDLVGEKLSEAFVCQCLEGIHGFAMIAPSLAPVLRYQLFVEDGDKTLNERVEAALLANPQYAYARTLGQLAPLQLVRVEQPLKRYQAVALAEGRRLGDIKPPSLRPEPDWETRLCGC